MKRIYLDPADCEKDGNNIYIKGSSSHYLINVLRMKDGDVFVGFDGSGYEYEIVISSINKRALYGTIIKTEQAVEMESTFNIVLFQCLPKGHKFDQIISDVAQLGVQKIYPVVSSRVIPHITGEDVAHKKARWKRIAGEASKVAGRRVVMDIEDPIKFEDALKLPSDIKIIFWEKSTTPLKMFFHNITKLKQATSINIFVGPEGGYTDEEVSLAEKYGISNVSMGKRIIRVETASVIAVALVIYEMENLED
ncbi:MAG: RsmE family RNA methyltransferase [Candidatus Ratteibacteria bacterium]|nr:RsmE family RNA methyltransferase [Candidatus Ratteibacteria bacterium]